MEKQAFDVEDIIAIAKNAGDIIMSYYGKNHKITLKNDLSPVTEADISANRYIVQSLRELAAHIPVIAEENSDKENFLQIDSDFFWLVDPIDGTKGFIEKNDHFTVNIALIKHKKPFIGVIYVPTLNDFYYSTFQGESYKIISNSKPILIKTKKNTAPSLDVLIGSNFDDGLESLKKKYIINSVKKIGSSLKLCFLASGLADAYPRGGTTMEWDTAAGHSILNSAGGEIFDYQNNPLSYGKSDFRNPPFIAFGNKDIT